MESNIIIQSIQTNGDGNCFFYAFLTCLLERIPTKEEVMKCKINCATLLSPYTLLPYCKEEVRCIVSKAVENDEELKKIVETDFDKSIERNEINNLLQQILSSFKIHISTDGIWPDDWAQQFCGKIHKVNIIVYLDSCKMFTPIFEIVEEWPVIVLFNRHNLHWEAAVIIIKKEGSEDRIFWKQSYENIKKLIN